MTSVGEQPDPRIWVRAVNVILAQFGAGELKPGLRLPALGMPAGELGTSRNVVTDSYQWLIGEAIIRRSGRNGAWRRSPAQGG